MNVSRIVLTVVGLLGMGIFTYEILTPMQLPMSDGAYGMVLEIKLMTMAISIVGGLVSFLGAGCVGTK
jgi:hypothetical protein